MRETRTYRWRAAWTHRGEIVAPFSDIRSFTLQSAAAPAWAVRAGGTQGGLFAPAGESGEAIATLTSGDLAVAGGFFDPAKFEDMTAAGVGGRDSFVARYRADDGALVWLRTFGSPGFDRVDAAAPTTDGGVVVAGKLAGTSTFGAGEPNETNIEPLSDAGCVVFLARYDAGGSLVWVTAAHERDLQCSARGLTVGVDGALYLTGSYSAGALFGAGEPTEATIEGKAIGTSTFVARFEGNGSFSWVRGIVPTEDSDGVTTSGSGAAAMADGGVVFTGTLRFAMTFGNGEPNETTLVSEADSPDIFMARYRADGSLLWARRAGGPGLDRPWKGTGFPSASGFVVAGTIGTGTASFDGTVVPGPAGFVARYDDDGNLVWVRALHEDATVFGVATFDDGGVVAAGQVDELPEFENEYAFVDRFDPGGTLEWTRSVHGTGGVAARAVCTLDDKGVGVTGFFTGEATFSDDVLLISAGRADIFVSRLPPH
jgi:hypothetical protein